MWILTIVSIASLISVLPPDYHKSIHQLEYEKHMNTSIPAGEPDRFTPLKPKRNLTHEIMGFLPYWMGSYDAFHWDLLSIVSWFSVSAKSNGEITNSYGWPPAGLVSTAHENGVRVVLTVTCFNSSTISAILSNSAIRKTLALNLLDEVQSAGADGVCVDFEGVLGSQKNNLVAFMQDLAELFHSEIPGSHVSICTPAVDWRGAFDYKRLAQSVDALFVMGYDYHWSGGDPGPVSPLYGGNPWGPYCIDWTVQDYREKLQELGLEKVILGVPFYGLDWPTVDLSVPTEATDDAKAYTYAQCQYFANDPDYGGRRWDPVSLVPYLLYDIVGPHQLWYDDAKSLAYKFDYAIQQNISGIGIWALNYEGDYEDVWDEIRERFYTNDNDDDVADDDSQDDDADDDSDNNEAFHHSHGAGRDEEDEPAGVCAGLF